MFFRDDEGSVPGAVLCCAPLSQMALLIVIIFLSSMLMLESTIRDGNKQIEMSYYKRVVLVSVAFH